MTANELRQKYLDFFKSKEHTIIPSASLVPVNDPSVLFTTAGMHPLVPYLLGEKHPGGKRVANAQKCIRTGDIDNVGDNRHLTFFEMLGNWSFGDYFKKEAIEWSFEFLTSPQWLGLDPKRLYVTVFKGEDGIPRDEDAIEIWKRVFKENAGMVVEVAGNDGIVSGDIRIIPLGIDDNFWIAGEAGPCGGDTEMFYDVIPAEGKLEGKFTDFIDSFRVMEMWNNVFMEFNKTASGEYIKLEKPNVDTGMGIERTLAILQGKENAFETELFFPLFEKIAEISGKKYEDNQQSFRIVADHLKAATFMIADGVLPSNTHRGYVLRRLIRRAVRYGKILSIEKYFIAEIARLVIVMYGEFYTELIQYQSAILEELTKEEEKFRKTLENGLREFEKISDRNISGEEAFNLFQSYGFPLELTLELARDKNIKVDINGFNAALKNHQDKSRTASAGMFKGGLADHSEETTKLHTAAHLLLAALRKVLGDHVTQKGSNITAERLRFDFTHGEKMTDGEKEQVESLVNEAIKKDYSVSMEEMTVNEAKSAGAMGVFDSKYGEQVKVYTVGNEKETFSKEICGGPHVEHTGILGEFKLQKEESSSAGVRRIKAVLQ